MQFVNDDMDELFRRAAENYPLDTKGGDFNKVLAALQNSEEPPPAEKRKGNKGRYLWLLMLLPLGLICNQVMSPGKKEYGTAWVEKEKEGEKQKQKLKQEEEKGQEQEQGQGLGIEQEQEQEQGKNYTSSDALTAERKTETKDNQATAYENKPIEKEINYGHSSKQAAAGRITKNRKAVATGENNQTAKPDYSDPAAAGMENATVSSFRRFTPSGKIPSDRKGPGMEWEGSLPPPDLSLERNSQMIKKSAKEKRFYAGIMGGVDMTMVKFQKKEDMGYDFGVVLGYELNRHWSVEAGVFAQKKSYYSDGKYYDVSKIYMPPNSKLAEVSGSCRMIELPVYARYSFSGKLKPYLSLGMSSYLMKQEDYSYVYQYTSGPTHVYDKTYTNASKNFFSAIHFSAGISKRLGKIADLRLEPYMKIPITGMGYGDLPLWSTGVHVGLTRRMF